jgi:hypothetical protein
MYHRDLAMAPGKRQFCPTKAGGRKRGWPRVSEESSGDEEVTSGGNSERRGGGLTCPLALGIGDAATAGRTALQVGSDDLGCSRMRPNDVG